MRKYMNGNFKHQKSFQSFNNFITFKKFSGSLKVMMNHVFLQKLCAK